MDTGDFTLNYLQIKQNNSLSQTWLAFTKEIKFEHKLLIESVSIFETYNPGAVCVLYAFDYKSDRWTRVWSIFGEGALKSNAQARRRPLPPKASRIFKPTLLLKSVFSDKLRLEFEHSQLDYYTELDAVEIAGIPYDIDATVRVATNLKVWFKLHINLNVKVVIFLYR